MRYVALLLALALAACDGSSSKPLSSQEGAYWACRQIVRHRLGEPSGLRFGDFNASSVSVDGSVYAVRVVYEAPGSSARFALCKLAPENGGKDWREVS